MKGIIITTLAAGLGWAMMGAAAEAARCPQGYIYRPSQGICQAKGKSIRYTRQKASRSELRRARIEARREARRAKEEAAKARKPSVVERRPTSMPMSPLMATISPDPFVSFANPYGRLVVPLPEAWERHVMAWAHENRHRLAVEIDE